MLIVAQNALSEGGRRSTTRDGLQTQKMVEIEMDQKA
jgi:hypothetical protein